MRDLMGAYEELAAHGAVGRAVVTETWGSAPRGVGACLFATAAGAMAGSVSGGCVEGATVEAIQHAIRSGAPRLLTWSVTQEEAWEAGLACGGTITVLVEPRVRPALLALAGAEAGSVLVTILSGPAAGSALAVSEGGMSQPEAGFPPGYLAGAVPLALDALGARRSRTDRLTADGAEVDLFLEVLPRRPTLLLIGAVHVAAELTPLARRLGYRVIVADAREGFLTPERFPEADRLLHAWPAEAFAQVDVTEATGICILSHDPKFDEPALDLALRSPAGYIGAIGAKSTQAERRARLRAAGWSEEAVARVRGPIGLDLGGREPAEIALAILAEITAVRFGRDVATLPRRGGTP